MLRGGPPPVPSFGATISGGGTIAGGLVNSVTADLGTVGGGRGNTAGLEATVGGGTRNIAGIRATVGGGNSNTASGTSATVPGGSLNQAAGFVSFAAGRRAKIAAAHGGTFLWADQTFADFNSTAANQFMARASGGVTFFTNSALTSGVTVAAGGGAWSSVSDRNAKENFAAVDVQQILQRLAAIPLQTWNYKTQAASIRHIGPMAQDFYAAFAFGEDDKHISTLDADGVALAAIQGLYQLLQQRTTASKQIKVELQQTKNENANLKAELKTVKSRLAELDALTSKMAKIEAALQKMDIMTAKKDNEKKSRTNETALVVEGSE